jgi:hypothetical protein
MTLHSKPVGVVFATTVLPASPVSGRAAAGLFVRGTRPAQPGDLCVRTGDRLVRVNGTSLMGLDAEELDEVRALACVVEFVCYRCYRCYRCCC